MPELNMTPVVAEMTAPFIEHEPFPDLVYPTSVASALKAFRAVFPSAVRLTPTEDDGEAARTVHDDGYVDFIREGAGRSEGSMSFPLNFIALPQTVVTPPSTFEGRHTTYFFDEVTRATPAACHGALLSAAAAQQGARWLADHGPASNSTILVSCRPPGHHALPSVGGGLCLFANAAIAARELATSGRVVVIDVDQDHGNGTQATFYDNPDVLTISIHAEGWPFVAGHEHETGGPDAELSNCNLVLPHGTAGSAYLRALEQAVDRARVFAPDYLIVALGFDAQKDQGSGFLQLETADFADIAAQLAGLGLPTLITTEGCYDYYDSTWESARHFFRSWGEGRS